MYVKKGNTITFKTKVDYPNTSISEVKINIYDTENNLIIDNVDPTRFLGNNIFEYDFYLDESLTPGWYRFEIKVIASDDSVGKEYIKFRVE